MHHLGLRIHDNRQTLRQHPGSLLYQGLLLPGAATFQKAHAPVESVVLVPAGMFEFAAAALAGGAGENLLDEHMLLVVPPAVGNATRAGFAGIQQTAVVEQFHSKTQASWQLDIHQAPPATAGAWAG